MSKELRKYKLNNRDWEKIEEIIQVLEVSY
jgi:hypothetical protein